MVALGLSPPARCGHGMDLPYRSSQWSPKWDRKAIAMKKRNLSKSITLKLSPTTVKLVNALLVRLMVQCETGQQTVFEENYFKSGEMVVLSWTKDHVRGWSMADPDKKFAGCKRSNAHASSLFISAQTAVAKGAPVSWISQETHHIQLERVPVVDENDNIKRVLYFDLNTSLPFITLHNCQRECTGMELHVLNNKWKETYKGILHYDGASLKAAYPSQWAEAVQIAKAKALV